jgi:hypothetical protein
LDLSSLTDCDGQRTAESEILAGFIFEAPSDHDPNGKNQIYNMSKKT